MRAAPNDSSSGMAATAHSAVAMMSASSGMMYVVIESLDPAVAVVDGDSQTEPADSESAALRHSGRDGAVAANIDFMPPSSGTHRGQLCAQVRGMITLCATKTSIAIHRKNKMVMPIQSPSNRVARCDQGRGE